MEYSKMARGRMELQCVCRRTRVKGLYVKKHGKMRGEKTSGAT
jgi:hypothetical protein